MIDRALIIEKHWLDLIFAGLKPWEMRSTKTAIRGRIGLIEKGTGTIVGEVDLVDSLPPLQPKKYFKHTNKHCVTPQDGTPENWRHPWVLENAQRYEEPVPYKHPQGAVVWVKLD